MALIAYNVGQVQFGAVLRSMLIVLAAVFVLTSLVYLLVRDAHKTGLIVPLVLVCFFHTVMCMTSSPRPASGAF